MKKLDSSEYVQPDKQEWNLPCTVLIWTLNDGSLQLSTIISSGRLTNFFPLDPFQQFQREKMSFTQTGQERPGAQIKLTTINLAQ